MRKIMCKLTDSITFSIYTGKKDDANLNNTNVIDVNKMVFTDQYILDNMDLVSAFLNVVVLKRKITRVNIKHLGIAPLILRMIKDIATLNKVEILEDKVVNYDVVDEIITNKNIRYLECYSMTTFLFDRLNMIKNIKIKLRVKSTKKTMFTEFNHLYSYSDVYYKRRLFIPVNMKREDVLELQNFFYVSASLKQIEVEYTDIHVLDYLIKSLKLHKLEHVKILIKQVKGYENNFLNDIEKMKKLASRNKKVKLKLVYHSDYKEKNIMKQINLNLAKTFFLLIAVGIIIIILVFQLGNMVDKKEEEQVHDQIDELILPEGTKKTDKPTPTPKIASQRSYPRDFSDLLAVNPDTKGWLSISNTSIHVPVVQTNNNSFYLTHSFDKSKNKFGWIFLDSRNSISPMSRNMIIYGHDSSNLMFGPLRRAYNSSWYLNKNNQIIIFNTLNETVRWQIFSIYITKNTSDYLRVYFNSDQDFLAFAKKLEKKSIYNFNTGLNEKDTILTLSTCHDEDRLVIHAKRVS